MPRSIAALFTDEGYPAGPSDIVARLERFATPEARVVVAEHDGALLGFIAFCALPRFEHDDWIVRIVALVVDAGARERGVGRTLMAEAERVGRGARGRIHRDHRGPSPSGRPPSLRVDRLRRVRDRLPAQEAVAEGRRARNGHRRPFATGLGRACHHRAMQAEGTAIGTDPVIRVRGLVKSYGDVRAVDGIDFEVAPGEVFGLLGPNGAGKTTTVEILEGLRAPDGGQAPVLGMDVATGADPLKPRIGISLQTASMYPKLTVVEIIDLFRSFYADLATDRRADRHARAGRAARCPDQGPVRRPAAAPGGRPRPRQRPRAHLPRRADDRARPGRPALVVGPIQGLKARGRSVLLTTHYMEEAEVLCDRLAIMDHGQDP